VGINKITTHIEDALALVGANSPGVVVIEVDDGFDLHGRLRVRGHEERIVVPHKWLGNHDIDALHGIRLPVPRPVLRGLDENTHGEGAHGTRRPSTPGPHGIEQLHPPALFRLQRVERPAQAVLATPLREDLAAVVGMVAPQAVRKQLVTAPGHKIHHLAEIDVVEQLRWLVAQSLEGLKVPKVGIVVGAHNQLEELLLGGVAAVGQEP